MSVNNVDKIMSYIIPISKDGCTKLVLNETIFYKDNCAVCGRCCIHEDLVFLPFEVDYLKSCIDAEAIDGIVHLGNNLENAKELYNSLVKFNINVNGKSYELYKSKLPYNTYDFTDRGILNRCHWCIPVGDKMLGCGIHQFSSLTCKFPHIRLNYLKQTKTTHIGLMQYGRNWALKCPVQFKKEFDIKTVELLIQKFELLKKYCDYFEIDNYCDLVIEKLKKVNEVHDIMSVCGFNLIADTGIKENCLI